MKKALSLLLSIVIMLTISVGCSNQKDNENKKRNSFSVSRSKINSVIETEKTTEEITEKPTEMSELSLSDGPVFFTGDHDSFNLTLFSLKDEQWHSIFSFTNNDPLADSPYYRLAIRVNEDGNYFHEQLFDSKLERMAVSWSESKDSSDHVGWLNKDGSVTDVTNIVHPATDGFSGKTPKDTWALFTSDDQFVFFDKTKEVFCYFDPVTESIVDTYDGSGDIYFPNPKIVEIPRNLCGLNPDNRPTTKTMKCGEDYYDGDARDYVRYSDGLAFFDIYSNCSSIGHYGPGITELHISPYDNKPSYTATFKDVVTITPETEYIIENLAYSNECIVFTATKGTERSLFKMSYVDRVAGEPEKICNIDESAGEIFFWKDA